MTNFTAVFEGTLLAGTAHIQGTGEPCSSGRISRRFPLVLFLVLFLVLSACHSWRVESIPPEQVISVKQPKKVRLVTTDNTMIELRQPSVAANVLSGNLKHTIGIQSIPLANVRSLETWQADGKKTGILVGGLAAVVAGLALLANHLNHSLCCD